MTEVVEGRVADKDQTVKNIHQRKWSAEKEQERDGHAFGVKQPRQRRAQQEQQERGADDPKRRKDHRIPEGAAHAVVLPCPIVLTNDRTNRARKRKDRAEGHGNQTADNGHARNGLFAEFRHGAGDEGLPDGRRTLLSGLDRSLGLDLDDGWLYIGEGSAVARVRFDAEAGTTVGDIERIVTGIPEGGNHWTRTLRIGPDGHIYLSVGSSCNVCEESDPRRAAMLRYRIDGSGEEIYAAGMRNSVGFDWRPGTNELYATDNGRDLLGDDFPPCELNRIERGGFYGWPYANGDNAPDPDFGAGNEAKVRSARAPDHGFRAHNAPLGMTFVRGDAAPGYRGAALVALHGSWNRSAKDGYKVVSLHWPSNGRAGPLEERDFLWGLEVDDDVIGRPVDVIEGPDGAFYISDDYANSVYRVAYGSAARATAAPGAATTIRDPLAAVQEAARPHLAATGSALSAVFQHPR